MTHHSLTFRENEIHFWQFSLNEVDDQHLSYLSCLLCTRERERSSKYHFSNDRDLFILARGVLRVLLGAYLDIDPAHIIISYNEWGKPILEPLTSDPTLHFNVSHSAGRVLIGVSRDYAIGVDIEWVDHGLNDVMGVAQTAFSQAELLELQRIPEHDRIEAFYRGWVRKEAFIKACGMGLSLPLDVFDVSLKAYADPVLRLVHDSHYPLDGIVIVDVPSVASHMAAAAVAGRNLYQCHFDGWNSVLRYLPKLSADKDSHRIGCRVTANMP